MSERSMTELEGAPIPIAAATLGVVFDLDGTLVDSARAIMNVGNALMGELGLPALDLAETRAYVGHGATRFVEQALAARGAFTPEGAAEAAARFEDFYAIADPRENTPFPHVDAALRALAAEGVALAVCTNKPSAPTHAALQALGWAELFPVVIAGDSLPQRKPDPTPLHEAIRRIAASRAVFVGDSEVDAETAKRAETPFLLFTEGFRKAPVEALPHDRAFSDWRELPGLVRAVAPR